MSPFCRLAILDRDLRAGELFNEGEGTCVVRVAVPVDDDLDVLGFEAELADRLDDHRSGTWHPGVEKDVAFLGREKPGTQALCADEVQRPDDLRRLGGLLPLQVLRRQCDEELVVAGQSLLRGYVGGQFLCQGRCPEKEPAQGSDRRQAGVT